MKYLASSIFISTIIFIIFVGAMKIGYFFTLAMDVAIKKHACLSVSIWVVAIFVLATFIRHYMLEDDKITTYYK
jgi:hypothetical protein